MKKTLIQAGILIAILASLFIGLALSLYETPYEYTQKHGNEETKKLYTVYKMAKDITSLKSILEYLKLNKIEYIEHKNENLISLHAETKGHSETVLIWHEKGKTTGARFDEFL